MFERVRYLYIGRIGDRIVTHKFSCVVDSGLTGFDFEGEFKLLYPDVDKFFFVRDDLTCYNEFNFLVD